MSLLFYTISDKGTRIQVELDVVTTSVMSSIVCNIQASNQGSAVLRIYSYQGAELAGALSKLAT